MKSVPNSKLISAFLPIAVLAIGCAAAPVRSTLNRPPTAAELAQLWVEPADIQRRDLFYGAGGRELAPDPEQVFEFLSPDTSGASPGVDVKDKAGREWDVKTGIEAQTEIVASRLLWAVGYHQPPTYYLARWNMSQGEVSGPYQDAGRFRPSLPSMKKVDEWSWHQNPYVGTRPFRGLLVVMLLMNNWDLKTPQNAVYDLDRPREGAQRWYVVRDLGAAFGKTAWPVGTKNDVEDFQEQNLIKEIRGNRIRFDYGARHDELFKNVTPADVRWICDLLARLSPKQWTDAFRAAGYPGDLAARFIQKLQEKIAEGRKLPAARRR